jgi:hypothetical protein
VRQTAARVNVEPVSRLERRLKNVEKMIKASVINSVQGLLLS